LFQKFGGSAPWSGRFDCYAGVPTGILRRTQATADAGFLPNGVKVQVLPGYCQQG
jgi:hypothetical protein